MNRRHALSTTAAALVFLVSLFPGWSGPAGAAPPGTTRIEEDWELVVRDPSILEAGPQVTTIMAPEPDPARTLMVFNLNFREEPFRQGGLQADCWYDESQVAVRVSDKAWPLFFSNETIRWTQRLSVLDNVLTYEITNGQSSSWGSFGSSGDPLQFSVTTHVTSLESYDPTFSADNSRVGWQANRAQSMRLLRVRYYDGNNLISSEDAPRNINLNW